MTRLTQLKHLIWKVYACTVNNMTDIDLKEKKNVGVFSNEILSV